MYFVEELVRDKEFRHQIMSKKNCMKKSVAVAYRELSALQAVLETLRGIEQPAEPTGAEG